MSEHTLKYGKMAREYDTTDFQDASVKRIINKLSDIDRAALPTQELEEVLHQHRAMHTDKESMLQQHISMPMSGCIRTPECNGRVAFEE